MSSATVSAWPRLPWRVTPFDDRIQEILLRWEGTRYHLGMQKCGVAVDCIRFVTAVADEMACTHNDYDRLPSDLSMHAPESAKAAMRLLMSKFKARRIDTDHIESGDVVICGPRGGGPGHAMIVGNRGLCFHSSSGGVQQTRLAGVQGFEVFHAILRVQDKESRWAVR